MTAAVVTASASVIVAVLAFVLNQQGQLRLERRQIRLTRINAQLRDLYGPLYALVGTNERIWQALRQARLPDAGARRSGGPLTGPESMEWRRWVTAVLMPVNRQMRDLVIRHADLLVEDEFPVPLQVFCAHVTAYEALVSQEGGADPSDAAALIDHPGEPYVRYVLDSFRALKAEQARLLLPRERDRPPRWRGALSWADRWWRAVSSRVRAWRP